MNKISIICPPFSEKERFDSDLGNSAGKQIPLGIYYLASFMRSKGYDVQVIDAEILNMALEKIIHKIMDFAPDYIGITSATSTFYRALDLAKTIKKTLFNVPLILGGPHVTSNYQHAMSYNEFDYGVLGEGEITLWELCEALSQETSLTTVDGIVYRDSESKGALIKTNPRSRIEDLDVLPFPALDLIPDINLYHPAVSNYKEIPVINLITSRGCPGQCTFCDKNMFGKKYRKRSAENVVEEIKMLKERYGVGEINFVDDTFLLDKQRIRTIFTTLKEYNIFVHWSCLSRVNDVDKEFLKFLKDHGCWNISFGIESGDEDILKHIKKNVSLKQVCQVVKWCSELSIKTRGYFIIGHPKETEETIKKTINFALSLKLDDAVLYTNTPMPGSPQYIAISQYGKLDATDWSKYYNSRPTFVPNGLSKELILKKQKEFYRRFYLRPRILFRYFLSFFGSGGIERLTAIMKTSLYLFKKVRVGNSTP